MEPFPEDQDRGLSSLDELSRALNQLGIDGGEVRRLEQTARLCQRLEWKMVRANGDNPDSQP
jgi:hypothetical protein